MADSIVVADNVSLFAENIQSKVGATLIGAKALAKDTTKGSEPIQSVLTSVKNLQQQTVDKVTEVWEVLKAQLEFEKDEARWLREQGPNFQGKAKKGKPTVKTIDEDPKEANKVLDWMKNNPLLSAAGAITAFKMFGKKLVKGGFWAIIASMLGEQVVNILDLEKDSISAEALGTYIPAGIFGAFLFKGKGAMGAAGGLAGALIGIAGMGIASISSWMLGSKEFKDISTFDWGAASTAGVAATLGVGTLMKVAGASVKAGTLAGALLHIPMILAVGLGAAAVVGGIWMYGKVQEYEQKMNDELEWYSNQTQKDWEKAMTTQKSGWADKWGLGEIAGAFGFEQTQLERQRAGTEGALDLVMKADDKTKALKPEQQAALVKTANNFLDISPESLKAILKDRESTHDYMETLNNLMIIAQHGAFGPEESKKILSKMLAHFQEVQSQSAVAGRELESSGESVPGYLTNLTMGKGKWGGDIFEKRQEDKAALAPMLAKQDLLKKQLADAEALVKKDPSWTNKQAVIRKESDLRQLTGQIKLKENIQANKGVKGLDWELIENVLGEQTLTKLSEANMKVIAKIIKGEGAVLFNKEGKEVPISNISTVGSNNSNYKNYKSHHYANDLNIKSRNYDFLYSPIGT